MPAVDPKKLKRLKVAELLTGFALKRRLSGAQLADLVQRAMSDKRFDLSAASDEFADYFLDEAEAADWAEELERSNKAPHLFTSDGHDKAKPEEMYGGIKKSEFDELSTSQQLAIANRVEFEKHAKKTQ